MSTIRSLPPLPAELVTFIESGLSMLVATRDAGLMPTSTRGVGVRIWPGASAMTAYLAAATSARCAADLRVSPSIAITMSLPATHRALQIKGTARAVRDAGADERAFVELYRQRFAAELEPAGLSPHLTGRLTIWPAFAVDVDIVEVFHQTPGPGAGARMAAP